MILKIKNMATSRCVTFVKDEFNKLGLYDITVELGKVELFDNISNEELNLLNTSLSAGGLEIIEDKNAHLIKEIKTAVYELINHFDDLPKPNYSEYISQKVNISYTHLSSTFSKEQGISIEKYIIEQRIERVKEFLVYSDLGLNDISYMLHFSSVAHLSNQFKKFTGLTPTFFREQASRIKTKNKKKTLRTAEIKWLKNKIVYCTGYLRKGMASVREMLSFYLYSTHKGKAIVENNNGLCEYKKRVGVKTCNQLKYRNLYF